MSATLNPSRNAKAASPSKAAAIDRIHVDLDEMVSRLRRELWLGGILALGTATVASLLVTLVIDAVFQPESIWLRVALWIPMIGVVGIITRHFLIMPLGRTCNRLAMAWMLEQRQPAIEERITSSLQFNENPNAQTNSIIEAVAEQAYGSLAGCQDEELRGKEVITRAIVAGASLGAFVFSMWIWAPYLIPSLQNVLNPFGSRVLPHLHATIVPGNTHVAEGGDLPVTATARSLKDAVLEVIESGVVVDSHQMATEENGKTADFTLIGLNNDRQYRVRVGGLYSDRYQIFVDPKPVIKSSQVNLTSPEYTQLPPHVISDPAEPIEVTHGTRIRIDVDATLRAGESSLSVDGTTTPCEEAVLIEATGLWRHSYEFTATAGDMHRGTITLFSDAGVRSDPFRIEVSTLPDLAPSIVIDQPALSEIIAAPDQSVHFEYNAVDDFGCRALHLNSQKNGEPTSTKELPHEMQVATSGELTIDLSELELTSGDRLIVWFSISDNRPDEYGGPQASDSRKIRIQIADDSVPVGQQVVRTEEQSVMSDLNEALEQLHEAAKITDELQADLDETDEAAKLPNDVVRKAEQLQERIKGAEQELRRLSGQNELAGQRLFQAELERIQEVTKNEVAEARKQAGMVPLSDELPQQQDAIAATNELLTDAIDKLEEVREEIKERGKQLELAAQFDELARQQDQIAKEQQENPDNAQDVQQGQQQLADALQEVVQQDLDAKSEQFAQRANEAAKLTETAADLQQQQETLANLDQARSKEELNDQLLDMIAREQKQIASETQTLEQQRRENLPPVAGANEQDQEEAIKTAEAEQKQILDVLTEARKQMEAVPEKLKQNDLEQAEDEANQASERLREVANSVAESAAAQANEDIGDNARQEEDDLKRLAKQQTRVRDAIKAIREDRSEEAAAKLQEQIADRTERLSDKADELLELPTDDPENQQAVREAREKLEQAKKETKAAEKLAKQQQMQAGEQQQQAGDPKKAGEQQQQAGDPKKAGEQQQQAGDPAKAGEQQQQAGDPKKAGEQQQQAGDPKKAGEQQQQAGDRKKASEQQQQAGDRKKAEEQQKQAAKSLKEATQSLEKVCKSCKECSKCNKPGGSSGSNGNSPQSGDVSTEQGDSKTGDAKQGDSKQGDSKQGDSKQGDSKQGDSKQGDSKQGDSKQGDSKQGDSKQGDAKQGDSKQGDESSESGTPSSKQQRLDSKKLAATADKAHQAARNQSPTQTQELAQELNQLADQAAQRSGYPNRKSKPQAGQSKPADSSDATQQAGAPQPGDTSKPLGVQGNGGAGQSEVVPNQLRGRSTSNWMQARRKLKGNVLDDQDNKIPDEFRSVVKDYFEELSRLDSLQDKPEKQE